MHKEVILAKLLMPMVNHRRHTSYVYLHMTIHKIGDSFEWLYGVKLRNVAL